MMSEVGAEEEEEMSMELLDSELVYFGADHKKFSTHGSCSLITSPCSTSSAAATIASSQISCTTTEEAANDRRSSKKQRKEGSANSLGTIKVRKDKLGDKISALQQLVSPFGKSDTASVLLEAVGYIRFLHDQVQVLSSPYLLQRLPTTTAATLQGGESEDDDQWRGGGAVSDLRSRGLCLVPIACTGEVAASDNGADFWSCAMGSCSSNGLYCSKH